MLKTTQRYNYLLVQDSAWVSDYDRDKPSLLRPDAPVSLYARGLICPEACKVPKTGLTLTLTLTLANTNPNPNSKARDVQGDVKNGQIGLHAKNNRANRAGPLWPTAENKNYVA
jgi:hypothetical protein